MKKNDISTLFSTCIVIIRIKSLYIILPKTNDNVKSYDGLTKWIYFLTEDDNFLEKYNSIRDKVSADIKRNLIVSLSTMKNF